MLFTDKQTNTDENLTSLAQVISNGNMIVNSSSYTRCIDDCGRARGQPFPDD